MTETTETRHLPVARSNGLSLQDFARLGTWLAAAESESKAPEALGAAAALRLYYAQALDLSLPAAAELHVIHGKVGMSAKALRALARRKGYTVERVDSSAESCTAVVKDADGEELGRETFTIAQAEKAGLVKPGSNWQKYPERMLWARAAKFALEDAVPDITLGILTTEEAEELEPVREQWADEPAPTELDAEPAAADLENGPEQSGTFSPPQGPRGGGGEEPEPEDEPGLPGGWDPADPAHPDAPWDSRRRGHLFALLNELEREGFHPEAPWANWKTVAEASASKHYGHTLSELTNREADDLIERIQARQSQLQAEAGEPSEASADSDAEDIPF